MSRIPSVTKFFLLALIVQLAALILAPGAFAGTGGSELSPAVDKLMGFIGGGYGDLISVIGVGTAAVASLSGKWPIVFSAATAPFVCQFGPAIVDGMVTALI